MPSDRLGQCKSLRKLLVSYTKVTDRGFKLALEHLPYLMVLDCCSSVQALGDKHRGTFDSSGSVIPKYSLTELHCTSDLLSTPYTSGDLGLAALLCPAVTKVRIVTQNNLTNDDLLGLLALSQLRELSISGDEVCNITFQGGIVPLLQCFGHCLESLTLAELRSVNIGLISELCPKLRLLCLTMNHSYSTDWPDVEHGAFTQRPLRRVETVLNMLESVHLVCVTHLWSESVIPSVNLHSLLGSPELKHLYAKDCLTLNDEAVQIAFNAHGFCSLEHLELELCHGVTRRAVDLLLSRSNPLKVVKLWQCRSLSRQNVDEWQKKAKQKKWELSLEWN